MGVTFQKLPCGRRFLKFKGCVFNLFIITFFFQFVQNLLHGIFHDFPVSSSVGNKKIFWTKYGHQLSFYIWVTRLVFKIDAIDGKKWVKFVGMQLNAAAFIYDLNTKNSIAIQRQYTSKFDISHLVL